MIAARVRRLPFGSTPSARRRQVQQQAEDGAMARGAGDKPSSRSAMAWASSTSPSKLTGMQAIGVPANSRPWRRGGHQIR
jgi:hypothetical protein